MDREYRDLFFGESQEYLKEINKALVKLEKKPRDLESINLVFRLMHSLKGMSATMGYSELAVIAHRLEDFFDVVRFSEVTLTAPMMDIIFEGIDCLATLIDDFKENRTTSIDISSWLGRMQQVMPEVEREKHFKSEEIDIDIHSFSKLKAEGKSIFHIEVHLRKDCPMKGVRAFLVLARLKNIAAALRSFPSEGALKMEEFDASFEVVLATTRGSEVIEKELSKISEIEKAEIEEVDIAVLQKLVKKDSVFPSPHLKRIQSMRIPVGRLDTIMNLIGELAIAKERLVQTVQMGERQGLEQATYGIEKLVSSLQEETLKMRLLPMSYILDAFPRVVRDLARKSGKEVDFEISGSEIELDRVILDEIGELLLHVIRNAIDHGLEAPEEREQKGKPLRGKVMLTVFREKGHIIVEINDDGCGIEVADVVKRALEQGLITAEETNTFDSKKVLDLLVTPGFSTRKQISDISGRGVGLDVVKMKLTRLGGKLEMQTVLGKGTTFIFILPLTLAIVKALLITLGEQTYAIPLMNIRETVKIGTDEVKMVKDTEVMVLREEIMPLLRLREEFGIPSEMTGKETLSIVVVEGRTRSLGVVVDKVAGEQEVVVKPLSSPMKKVKGLAGATILGDGKVALILDVMNIV